MNIALVFFILFLTTTVYAILLQRTRGAGIEPAYTWLEVVIGSFLCLLASGVIIRTNTLAAWESYQIVCASFVVGGTPIIAWQIGLDIRRRQREVQTIQRLHALRTGREHYGTAPTPSPAARRQRDD